MKTLALLGILCLPGCIFGWAMVDHQNHEAPERMADDACDERCANALESSSHDSVTGWVEDAGCGCRFDDGSIVHVGRRP